MKTITIDNALETLQSELAEVTKIERIDLSFYKQSDRGKYCDLTIFYEDGNGVIRNTTVYYRKPISEFNLQELIDLAVSELKSKFPSEEVDTLIL